MKLFGQSTKEFFSSKSNWTGLTMIMSGIVSYRTKVIDPVAAVNMIMGGIALICVKDAIAKK